MGGLGRNDPCPCGSGKKYKKCCLGTPRDPEGRPHRESPETSVTAQGHTEELRSLLGEILSAGSQAMQKLGRRCMDNLAWRLNLNPAEVSVRKSASALILYCSLGSENLIPEQQSVRNAVRNGLRSEESKTLYSQLLETPMRVWSLSQSWWGPMNAWTLLGPRAFRKERIANSFTVGEVKADDRVVGWALRHKGPLFLLGISQLRVDGLRLLEKSVRGEIASSDDDFWRARAPDLLRAIVDPRCRIGAGGRRAEVNRTDRSEQSDSTSVVAPLFLDMIHARYAVELADAWHWPIRFQMAGWEDGEVRWFREQVAKALTAEERGRFFGRLQSGLEQRFRKTWPALRPVEITKHADLDKSLAPFGLRADGTFPELDEEALLRRPVSLLALPDDHPLWADVSPSAPIRNALLWAGARAGADMAASVEEGFRQYISEERWLATCRPIVSGKSGLDVGPAYEEIVHALAKLFNPAASEAPLSAVELGRGCLPRLSAAVAWALQSTEPEGGWRIRDLPRNRSTLLDAPGYGSGTQRLVEAGLLAYAESWRPRRVGIDPATLDRLQGPSQASETLREGLDEIASLFELS